MITSISYAQVKHVLCFRFLTRVHIKCKLASMLLFLQLVCWLYTTCRTVHQIKLGAQLSNKGSCTPNETAGMSKFDRTGACVSLPHKLLHIYIGHVVVLVVVCRCALNEGTCKWMCGNRGTLKQFRVVTVQQTHRDRWSRTIAGSCRCTLCAVRIFTNVSTVVRLRVTLREYSAIRYYIKKLLLHIRVRWRAVVDVEGIV